MTDRELMQMALNALEECYDVQAYPANGETIQDDAIKALRARLAQPEKEWVGLTDAEAMEIEDKSPDIRWAIIQAEAKLKEKNT